jgi:hypothetical protein
MSALLVWMAGGDRDLLARCPSERHRFVALGGAVAMTALLAAAAGTFASSDWLHIPLGAGAIIGAFWGLAIMNLDRWLLIATRRQSSPWKTVLLALPRVALAVVVGLVIAEPLVLRVFHNEVTDKATELRQTEYQAEVKKLKSSYAEIPVLEKQKAALERSLTAIDSGAVLRTNPQYRAVTRQLASIQRRRAAAEAAALCELDRTCGSRGGAGSPAYEAKRDAAQALKGAARMKQAQLRELRAGLLVDEAAKKQVSDSNASQELTSVTKRLDEQRRLRAADVSERFRTSHAPIGLLERVEALGVLTDTNASMRYERRLLQLFILLIDSVPILFKTLTLLGRPSLYEEVQDEVDNRGLDRVRMQAAQQAIADEIEASTIVVAAKSRQKYVHRVIDALSAKIVGTQREVAESAVRDWASRVRAKSAEDAANGAAGPGGPTVPPTNGHGPSDHGGPLAG